MSDDDIIECFCCGICCTRYQPQLAGDDALAIADWLDMPVDTFLALCAQLTLVGYLLYQKEGRCVFLGWNESKTRAFCRIYPVRPLVCREWVASLAHKECREGLARLKESKYK